VNPALYLSVFGFCCVGITSIVGVILGIMALREIEASDGMQTGKAKAIAAIAIGGLIILVMLPSYLHLL
jgi:uncharacterized membrane protein